VQAVRPHRRGATRGDLSISFLLGEEDWGSQSRSSFSTPPKFPRTPNTGSSISENARSRQLAEYSLLVVSDHHLHYHLHKQVWPYEEARVHI
jgi:hypothetical protein